MILIFFALLANNFKKELRRNLIDDFYQLDPVFRLFFSFAYVAFAAGLLVRIWHAHEINYIHILQVQYQDRVNPWQFWQIGSLVSFMFLLIVYTSFQEIGGIYLTEY